MTITEDQIAAEKQIIIMELSEHDANSTLIAPNIDALWTSMSSLSGGDVGLQSLLTKRRAIDILIGSNWRTGAAPLSGSRSQSHQLIDPVSVLRLMREDVQSQIASYATMGRLNLDIYEPDESEF